MTPVYQKIKQKQSLLDRSQYKEIHTIDMHTCGEPLRVVLSGYPEIKGENVLEKRQYVKEHLDHYRTSIMFEPRGHADMYGCLIVPPNDEGADFGIIFMHNEGYSTMCGHATIAIATLAAQLGWINISEGENVLKIDAPCGRLTAFVDILNGQIHAVRFHCVPSFVAELDLKIYVPNIGEITYDLGYGGAFYAYVDLAKNQLDLDLTSKDYQKLIQYGMNIKRTIMHSNQPINHPFEPDLSFLYGTIFIGAPKDSENDSRNVCVFADGEVDRCPTGSGVSGRMAIHFARNELQVNEQMKIESIIDTVFTVKVVEEVMFGQYSAVIPEVSGTAFITGEHYFLIDPQDSLKKGFILR